MTPIVLEEVRSVRRHGDMKHPVHAPGVEFRIDGGVLVQGYFVRGGLNQATKGISKID